MANTIKCGDCALYYAIVKPDRRGKEGFDTGRGHCLDKTIYAKNKPGNPVFPPRARVEDLPYGRHKIFLRKRDELVEQCTAAKERS